MSQQMDLVQRVVIRYHVLKRAVTLGPEGRRLYPVPAPQAPSSSRETQTEVSVQQEMATLRETHPNTQTTFNELLDQREEKNRRRRRSLYPRSERKEQPL